MTLLELWQQRDAVDAKLTAVLDVPYDERSVIENSDVLMLIDERAEIGREIQKVYAAFYGAIPS